MAGKQRDVGTLASPKAGSFGASFLEAILIDFESPTDFAASSGLTLGRISQVVNNHRRPNPETLKWMIRALRTVPARLIVREAYIREFLPSAYPQDDLSAPQVVNEIEGLVANGKVGQAVSLGRKFLSRGEFETVTRFSEWFMVAERVVPLLLRIGHVTPSLHLTTEIERRAVAARNQMAEVSAVAMQANVLASIDMISVADVSRSHERVLAAIERWNARSDEEAQMREYRAASNQRVFALNLLRLFRANKIGEANLKTAYQAAQDALRCTSFDFMVPTGLEVRSRIELAEGHIYQARGTIEELEDAGLEKGWELWEKSRLTLARIALIEKKKDLALSLFEGVRQHCQVTNNRHHEHVADQEAARILLGLSD